jgi:hypothetical protein
MRAGQRTLSFNCPLFLALSRGPGVTSMKAWSLKTLFAKNQTKQYNKKRKPKHSILSFVACLSYKNKFKLA